MITENCLVGCTNDNHHFNCDHSLFVPPPFDFPEYIEPDINYKIEDVDQYAGLKFELSKIIVDHKLLNFGTNAIFKYKRKCFISFCVNILKLPLKETSKLIVINSNGIKRILNSTSIKPRESEDTSLMMKKLNEINDTKVCVFK